LVCFASAQFDNYALPYIFDIIDIQSDEFASPESARKSYQQDGSISNRERTTADFVRYSIWAGSSKLTTSTSQPALLARPQRR
jgi:hypothetical protein